jgi:hypothetical protein
VARTPEQKRDAAKDARLKKFFRTSLEEYRAIEKFEEQYFSPLLGGSRRGLDHDHKTGLIRGVLDWRINKALGIIENSFKENTPYVLRALSQYLFKPPALSVIGERYGLIGKAQNKKKMIYGPPVTQQKRKKKNA